MRRRPDLPILISAGGILAILAFGATLNRNFLSVPYLLQQVQVASFLGVIAAGQMLVILLGQIDLSVPWTVTTGAMMATAIGSAHGPVTALTLPLGMLCGALVGVLNGTGVAVLRIPSMIFSLGMNAVLQGLMVLYSGGFAPQTHATPLMQALAVGSTFGVPHAALVWLLVSLVIVFLLRATTFGRGIYAVGNRESVAYLSGVRTRLVIIGCFTLSGCAAALGGILLAGYSSRAYQGMGDAYVLPAIAAVVLGGTNILGGSGRYVGTVLGVLFICLLQSMLSVLQMPQAGRQIIYGATILAMLLVYGRTVARHR